MTPTELMDWRARKGLSQRGAAQALGVALTTYQEMERGRRFGSGKPVVISLMVELACRALENNS